MRAEVKKSIGAALDAAKAAMASGHQASVEAALAVQRIVELATDIVIADPDATAAALDTALVRQADEIAKWMKDEMETIGGPLAPGDVGRMAAELERGIRRHWGSDRRVAAGEGRVK